jgi:NAD(P)H-hydrate epimerase
VVAVCDRGNPGMASGGMGDVLTGAIAGLRAQGLSSADAARLGVWVHAAAGDDAAAAGEIGLLASDLFPHLRTRLNRLVGNADR